MERAGGSRAGWRPALGVVKGQPGAWRGGWTHENWLDEKDEGIYMCDAIWSGGELRRGIARREKEGGGKSEVGGVEGENRRARGPAMAA